MCGLLLVYVYETLAPEPQLIYAMTAVMCSQLSYRAAFVSACYQTVQFVRHDVAVYGLRLQTSMRSVPVKWLYLKFSLFAQLW